MFSKESFLLVLTVFFHAKASANKHGIKEKVSICVVEEFVQGNLPY